jgi:hypothetical protein
MTKRYALGLITGSGLGIALYFLVVHVLPILGKQQWIWT